MKRKFFTHIVFLIILTTLTEVLSAQTTKIVTYNILNFPEVLGMDRIDDYRIVLDFIDPDVLVVQEIGSRDGVTLFLDSVMNYRGNQFEVVPFNDGPDTDNALFYHSHNIEFLSASYIPTSHRDIAEYRLQLKESPMVFHVFSVHLKSSQGADNELLRLEEATILRNHLDSLDQGVHVLVVGDFNIYSSDEAAFQKLTGNFPNNNGRLFDPLSLTGQWHENSSHAYSHTQSTRVEQLGDGGAGGGLDDRFDMVLCSQSFLDSIGLYLLSQSYTIYGNDGEHFDMAVNEGANLSVPDSVADALYYASDHLPVAVSICQGIVADIPKEVVKIWPNPMQREAHIQFPWIEDFEQAQIWITNILGQRIYEARINDPEGMTLNSGALPVGIYFVHTEIETRYTTYKYQTRLAVIK